MYDFAIIGSGTSGGRVAYELTMGGAKCVLLEAGREYSAKNFPNNEMDYSTQLFWGGGLEVSADGHMGFLRAKCVGGTSIVNQALLDRFDDLAWDDWKSRSGVSFFNQTQMESHYEVCEMGLSVQEIPKEFYNRNAKIFTAALEQLHYGWKPLHRAQGECKFEKGSDCIVCLGGCPRNSKQSSLITTIRWAREKGLEVISNFEVDHVVYGHDGVEVRGKQTGAEQIIRAKQVFLAAGTLGNSSILFKSKLNKKIPALGTGFCCHPQLMSYALFDTPVDSHKGAFQAVKSNDRKIREAGYKLENVYAPPIGTSILMPGVGQDLLKSMKKYRYWASIEVAVRDEAVGKISLAGSKLKVQKTMTDLDKKKAAHGLNLVREVFEVSGAREVIQCPQTFGLHLMGGCPIGTEAARAVVDPEFKMHGFPKIWIGDSSIFPAAPGINPSFTIMALSHRAAQNALKR